MVARKSIAMRQGFGDKVYGFICMVCLTLLAIACLYPVLNVVAKGDSFEEARERAYEACDLINFEGKMFRHDIGKKALQGRSAWDE